MSSRPLPITLLHCDPNLLNYIKPDKLHSHTPLPLARWHRRNRGTVNKNNNLLDHEKVLDSKQSKILVSIYFLIQNFNSSTLRINIEGKQTAVFVGAWEELSQANLSSFEVGCIQAEDFITCHTFMLKMVCGSMPPKLLLFCLLHPESFFPCFAIFLNETTPTASPATTKHHYNPTHSYTGAVALEEG